MPSPKGLLLVTMEPPPTMEEEFNDWYDNEHVPERSMIPGFETALRFVCVSGWPRYLALYDLEQLDVLDGPGYTAVSGTRFSPWSKRVLGRVRGQSRMAAIQIFPAQALTGKPARMLFLRFAGIPEVREDELVTAIRRACECHPGLLQIRVFREPTDSGPRYLALMESSVHFRQQRLTADLGDFGRHLEIINEYAQYWTRGELHGVYDNH